MKVNKILIFLLTYGTIINTFVNLYWGRHMLLTNLSIIASVYAVSHVTSILKKKHTIKNQSKQLTTIPEAPPKPKSLHYAIVSGSSIGAIALTNYCILPLSLVSVAMLSYSTLPIFHKTQDGLIKERKFKNHGYSSLTMVLLLGAGNYVAAAISSGIYHISEHIIDQSRKETAKLASQVYQQAPEMVWVENTNGIEQEILLTELKAGDIVVVSTGGVIPVDGVIFSGMALIDRQALTGEANPLEKHKGDEVLAATIVLSGRIGIRAKHSGEENRINHLNKLLHKTESYKSNLQLKGEQWSNRIALPVIVVSTALIPIVGWSSSLALLFSVPMSTVRSMLSMHTLTQMRQTNEQGVLIKDGRVLEELPRIDVILFDKTGTLTQTNSEVRDVISCGIYTPDELLAWAAAAEKRLEHPIAQAIVAKAKQKKLKLPKLIKSNYDLGLGVTVYIDEHLIHVGSGRFVQKMVNHTNMPTPIKEYMEGEAGYSHIIIAVDNEIQGVLGLSPRVRPEVPAMMKSLRRRGFKQLSIVSGDQVTPTQQLADKLKMDKIYADVLPQDKAGLIRQLQDEGHHVCFIGDGINDAIALKQANVSICLQSASVIANEMAQVIMINESLAPLDGLFDMSTNLQKKLSRSLYFWVGFGAANTLAVPILGFGPLQSSLFYISAYTAGLLQSSGVYTSKSKKN